MATSERMWDGAPVAGGGVDDKLAKALRDMDRLMQPLSTGKHLSLDAKSCIADRRAKAHAALAEYDAQQRATPSSEPPTRKDGGSLVERLEQTVRGLTFNRGTHVEWRDWLLKNPANEQVNPHAGSAEFHDNTIKEYDQHIANIKEAVALLAARSKP